MFARGRAWLSMAPLRTGSSPVSRAARLGAHDGDATKVWVNVTPSAAIRVMFGVRVSFAPKSEQSAHPRSSAMKNTTFGGAAASREAQPSAATARSMRIMGKPCAGGE